MDTKVFYNVCPAAGCHQNCVLKLFVKEGKIVKVESADYPGDPDARCVCLRGLASLRLVYHPDRLKYPLKRVGARGEGKWQRISWDEAYDTIASKLLEIKKEHGPQSVKIISGGSSCVGLINGRLVGARFANVWGAGGNFEGRGYTADGGMPSSSLMVLGDSGQGHDAEDHIHSKMVVLWGWNPAETSFRAMKHILDAKDHGAKLIVVGPLFDATAAKADLWIPVRMGADAALALGMMNVIFKEGLYDREFLTKYTVAPFLVRGDNDLFLRGEKGEYLVWDEKVGNAVSASATAACALQGDFTVAGIKCKTALQRLIERAKEYPPEKAAEISGVPAQTIVSFAREYATSKPASIKMSDGMARTIHATIGCKAIITLGALTGNIGIPGGGASNDSGASPIELNNAGVSHPSGAPGVKALPNSPNAMRGWRLIREGKPYPIKALINFNQNAVQSYGQAKAYHEIFEKIGFVVVGDIFMTYTAREADIVLPDATVYERDDISVTDRYYLVRMEKAIEPLYESSPTWQVWSELAQRLEMGQHFRNTPRQYIDILLSSKHPTIAGITRERLEKEKIVRANVPPELPVPFADRKFPTPSGRVEFYVERQAKFGEALPVHKESLESPRTSPLAKKYPLSYISAKKRTTTQTIEANVDWMLELESEPHLEINPKDAAPRGIKNDDLVVLFNDRGKAKLKASLTERVPAGMVNVGHGWWPEHFVEGHYADPLHPIDDPNTISPAMEIEAIIKDTRAAMYVLYYDCLVEVKKA